jgi:hypothetical protein
MTTWPPRYSWEKRYFVAFFISNACNAFIVCLSVLETLSIRVPVRNIRFFNTVLLRFHAINVLLLIPPQKQLKSVTNSTWLCITHLISIFWLLWLIRSRKIFLLYVVTNLCLSCINCIVEFHILYYIHIIQRLVCMYILYLILRIVYFTFYLFEWSSSPTGCRSYWVSSYTQRIKLNYW